MAWGRIFHRPSPFPHLAAGGRLRRPLCVQRNPQPVQVQAEVGAGAAWRQHAAQQPVGL